MRVQKKFPLASSTAGGHFRRKSIELFSDGLEMELFDKTPAKLIKDRMNVYGGAAVPSSIRAPFRLFPLRTSKSGRNRRGGR